MTSTLSQPFTTPVTNSTIMTSFSASTFLNFSSTDLSVATNSPGQQPAQPPPSTPTPSFIQPSQAPVKIATPTFATSSSLSKLANKLNTKLPSGTTEPTTPLVQSARSTQPPGGPPQPSQQPVPAPLAKITIKPSFFSQEHRGIFNKSGSNVLSTTANNWLPSHAAGLLDTSSLLPAGVATTTTTISTNAPIGVSSFLENSQQFSFLQPQLGTSTLHTSPPRSMPPSLPSAFQHPQSSLQQFTIPTTLASSTLLPPQSTTNPLGISSLFRTENPSFLAPSQSITFDPSPTLNSTATFLPPSSAPVNPLSQPHLLPPPLPVGTPGQPGTPTEERLLGSFGTELDQVVNIGTAKPGDVVLFERDLQQPLPPDSFRVLVKTVQHIIIGSLPTRISQWFSHILLSGRVRLLAKIPKYKTDKVLVVIDLFGQKLTSDDWRHISLSEKGAWHQLAASLGIPVSDIVPARALSSRLDFESVVAQHNARGVASTSNARSSSASSSGGLKRPAEDSVEPADRAKRPKFNTSTPVGPGQGSGMNHSLVFPPPLAVSSPSVRGSNSVGVPLPGDSASELTYIDRLFKSLRNQLPESTTSVETSPRLLATLRPYQQDALKWMVNRELNPLSTAIASEVSNSTTSSTASPSSSSSINPPRSVMQLPPGWQELKTDSGKVYYINEETKTTYWTFPYDQWAQYHDRTSGSTPLACCGGLLADDMGMGKTIQILSLMLTNTPTAATRPFPPSPANSWSTLVVCPLSVLNQWTQEIERNTQRDSLSVYIYHGTDRNKDPNFLAEYDVVLTTYATLATELATSPTETNGPLMKLNWFRIVLDEAHTIKDRSTRTAKAAFALQANRRWAVTGTPIQNKLNELFSLFQFLQLQPYGDYSWWNNVIMKPIRNRDERGLERLRSVLSTVLLRRTKDQKIEGDKPIVALPTRTVEIHSEPLANEENDFYQLLWNNSKEAFESMMAQGTVLQNYAHILELLLRLRQACDHPGLVLNDRHRRSQRISQEKKLSTSKQMSTSASLAVPTDAMQFATSSELMQECNLCLEPISPTDVWTTKCGHVFCLGCISSNVRDQQATSSAEVATCPMCNEVLLFDKGDLNLMLDVAEETSGDESGPADPKLQNAAEAVSTVSNVLPVSTTTTTTSTNVLQDDKMQMDDEGQEAMEVSSAPVPAPSSFDFCKSMALPIVPPAENDIRQNEDAMAVSAELLPTQPSFSRFNTPGALPLASSSFAIAAAQPASSASAAAPQATSASAFSILPPETPSQVPAPGTLTASGNPLVRSGWSYLEPMSNYPSISEPAPEPLALPAPTSDKILGKPGTNSSSGMAIANSSSQLADFNKKLLGQRRSTKINAVIKELKQIRTNDTSDKTIIFSQWTSMLDLLEVALKEEVFQFVRLDGKMSQKSREAVIKQFKTNPNVTIFLISLKAGGLGLNLVEANHCLVCDPWWNPAIEEQAIDRIHRIGQTKPVFVTRFIMKNTIEERILELQEKKRQLALGALGRNSKTLKDMRLEELKLLFRD